MTSQEIQKKAKEFKKRFGMPDCSYDTLKKITERQGYTIVTFHHVSNDTAVQTLIESLNLQVYAAHSKGFTYADGNYRIVFIHEDLNSEEKKVVLAHENGHIYLGHFKTAQVIGKDVQEEYEANEFAHYLLRVGCFGKLSGVFSRHKKLMIAMIALLLLGSVVAGVYGIQQENKQYYGEYYITASGSKYHKKDCIFVKDKSTARRLTRQQFDNGDYEPCQMCLPQR